MNLIKQETFLTLVTNMCPDSSSLATCLTHVMDCAPKNHYLNGSGSDLKPDKPTPSVCVLSLLDPFFPAVNN